MNDTINKVSFEWCVEWTDEHGDIHDLDHGSRAQDVWPPCQTESRDAQNLMPVPCHSRHYGCDANGEPERGYAYKGDIEYCSGQKVRPHIVATLARLT